MKRINLIPEEAKKITAAKWLKIHILKSATARIVTIGVICFLCINIWQATTLMRYKFLVRRDRQAIKKLQMKLASAQGAYAKTKLEKEKALAESKLIEGKLKILQQTRSERIAWAKVLTQLSILVPQDLWVSRVALSKDITTIAGATLDIAIVSRFMASLDASNYFKDTNFNYTQKAKLTERQVVDFEITTRIVLEKAARDSS